MVDVIPSLGGLLYFCSIILACKMQYRRLVAGVIPGDAQAILRCTDVDRQAVYF